MSKFNMFASGFCACACFIKAVEGDIKMAITIGLLALVNFILGMRDN